MAGLQVGDNSFLRHLYTIHNSSILPSFLHHDTRWISRRPGRRPAMVRQMHISHRSLRSLQPNNGRRLRRNRHQILRRLLHVLPILASLGQPHQFSRLVFTGSIPLWYLNSLCPCDWSKSPEQLHHLSSLTVNNECSTMSLVPEKNWMYYASRAKISNSTRESSRDLCSLLICVLLQFFLSSNPQHH